MQTNDPAAVAAGPLRPPRILLLSLAIVAADQATKAAARSWLAPIGTRPVIPGWFELTFVANPGALFGLGRGFDSPLRTLVFNLVPAAAAAVILVLLWRGRRRERWYLAGLALILGGAVGNLADRIRFGHVIDFLDFHWRDYHWPAFNLADACICIGVGMLGFDLLRERRDRAPAG